jgi:hypothetical protein
LIESDQSSAKEDSMRIFRSKMLRPSAFFYFSEQIVLRAKPDLARLCGLQATQNDGNRKRMNKALDAHKTQALGVLSGAISSKGRCNRFA